MHKLILAGAIAFLTGCGDSDVKKFIKHIHSNKGHVEALPSLADAKTYQYGADNLRSPFGEEGYANSLQNEKLIVDQNINQQDFNNSTVKAHHSDIQLLKTNPERNRDKAYLEQFALKDLKYVGSMRVNNYAWALILDPQGKLHHLQVGDYLGLANGKIEKISEQNIAIRELIPNNQRKWENRAIEMPLSKAQKNNNEQDKSDKGES